MAFCCQFPGRLARPGTALVTFLALALPLAFWCATPASADDSIPTQWQLDARAESLQHAPPPAEKPVICIVDTGVTPTPDLDIVSRTALDGGTPDDITAVPGKYGHGTTVAHMAAGKVNGWGASGTFPHARIASVRIFSPGEDRVPWTRYNRALQWCAAVRPRPAVSVLALGATYESDLEAQYLRDAIADARGRVQMSVVAAAGNGGAAMDVPARFPETFSVAGSDAAGALCSFSGRGENVDVMAPACGLFQAGWQGSQWRVDGTSFAAPIVAGALAALSAYRSDLAAIETESVLVRHARGGEFPLLDVAAGLAALGLRFPTSSHVEANETANDNAAELVESEPPAQTAEPPVFRPAVARPLESGGSHRRVRRSLAPPRTSAIRVGRVVRLKVSNRPTGLAVQVKIGSRAIVRARSVFSFRTARRRFRLRFIAEGRIGPWTRVLTRT